MRRNGPAEDGGVQAGPQFSINQETMKILLAVDTSSASQAALREILDRPWPADSSFEVMSVVEPSHRWTNAEIARDAAQSAQEVIQKAVEQLRTKGHTASGAIFSGDPKAVILEQARKSSADLLLVGAQGVSRIERFFLGTVAATVLRYAPCSVEVVRAKRAGSANPKILLAVDGSDSSRRAAQSIAERPWRSGTEVRVLSAVELILPAAHAFFEPPFADSAFLETARADAMKRSQDAIAEAHQILAAAGLDVSEAISVLLDTPRAIILKEANEWVADLIVVGSHGRHGVDRFLLGSVSESVAIEAGCSVEVVRRAV